jgi:uncharacterized membrane protein YkvA (DUF1232 family)
MEDYSAEYSDKSFWDKVKEFAIRAGKEIIEKALVLYYCLEDPDTPKWARAVIVGALGYFIVPLDAIPDLTPIIGFVDDLGALAAALGMVAVHIKPEHRKKARNKMKDWFGEDDEG